MELAGVLLNPETGARLARLAKALVNLKPEKTATEPLPKPPPAQGQVLRAIKAVLADYPEGRRTVEIRQLVEAHLGRQVAYATIKAGLASHAGAGGSFERLRRGVYRAK
jgi:hypothetical protein